MTENSSRESIGRNIRTIRESHDMEQQELARYIGVNKSSVCQYEKGAKIPSLLTAINIAKVLRCSLDDICGIN